MTISYARSSIITTITAFCHIFHLLQFFMIVPPICTGFCLIPGVFQKRVTFVKLYRYVARCTIKIWVQFWCLSVIKQEEGINFGLNIWGEYERPTSKNYICRWQYVWSERTKLRFYDNGKVMLGKPWNLCCAQCTAQNVLLFLRQFSVLLICEPDNCARAIWGVLYNQQQRGRLISTKANYHYNQTKFNE